MDHDAPSIDVETQILKAVAAALSIEASNGFINRLAVWANANRDTEAKGAIAVSVSTRRLIHILRTFDVVGDENKAIALCVARFDTEVSQALMMLWKSLSAAQGSPADVTTTAAESATV
ncbi:MAG: hypothetical protein DDT26_01817 [Dehalococcoidia bacterium]|nr:hypothetical protein [Chloroflexota bacterium]